MDKLAVRHGQETTISLLDIDLAIRSLDRFDLNWLETAITLAEIHLAITHLDIGRRSRRRHVDKAIPSSMFLKHDQTQTLRERWLLKAHNPW